MKNGMALPMQSANNSNISSPANSCLSFTNTNITTNSTIATTPAVAAATFASVVDSSTSLFQEEQKPIIPLQVLFLPSSRIYKQVLYDMVSLLKINRYKKKKDSLVIQKSKTYVHPPYVNNI